MKKMISWNVNGLRACVKKGFLNFVDQEKPDMLCLQEIKLQEGQIVLSMEGYHAYWNYADRKGYSGTAIFTKEKPLSSINGIGIKEHDTEGRVITLEYPEYYLVTVYTPNSKRELSRLPYRLKWEDAFLIYLKKLEQRKPVIFCGDLNVAHREIDLKNPKSNQKNSGFTKEERAKMTALIESGFLDTYRYFYPNKEGAYTWWSYLYQARERNIGWRIDYFLISQCLKDRVKDAMIYEKIQMSDHCPVGILIEEF